MEKLSILTADLLDILFEYRNKLYGAYELRKTYPKRVAYALAGTVVLCLLFVGGTILARSYKPNKPEMNAVIYTLEKYEEKIKPVEPPPVEPPKQELPKVEMTTLTPPRIVAEDVPEDEQIKPLEELEIKRLGDHIEHGTGDIDIVAPPVEKTIGKVDAPKVEKDIDGIFVTVQRQAEYPGGVDAWRRYLERNLNRDVPNDNGAPPGRYTVTVSFVVDTKGSLSDIRAENDPGYGTKAEAIRVLQKSINWNPAEQNGSKVMYRQKQNITFVVE